MKHAYFRWRYWVIGFFWSLLLLTGCPSLVHATDINLSGSQNPDLSAKLSWTLSNNTNNDNYSYQLQESDLTNNKISTIGTKDQINVLNISPWDKTDGNYASLKTWIESTGYGQNKINVDTVNIADFSQNANSYLKDSSNNYRYDVIVFGFADCNQGHSISQDAVNDVLAYAKTGRGVLMGHDTTMAQLDIWALNPDGSSSLYPSYSMQSFPFSSQLGIILTNASSYGKSWFTGSDGSLLSHIKLRKNGYLINYPNEVGKVGDVLTIPHSHVSGQWTNDMNSVWADFVDQNNNPYTPDSSARVNTHDGGTYDASFETRDFSDGSYDQFAYLITKNNWGLIQTGHANGQATNDEQKLIANTLFYLGQVTNATSFTTHTSQDLASPDKPTFTHNYDGKQRSISFNNLSSNDHGNQYSYRVIGTNLNDDSKVQSNDFQIECKTGVKQYLYTLDHDPNGQVTLKNGNVITNGQSISLPQNTGNYYLHVAAVDGNNNISSSTSDFIDGTSPELNITNTDLQTVTHSAESLNLKATDSDSGVDSIQTPDGTWHSGDSVAYQVDKNGTYSFVAKDKAGNTVTKSITVSNIYPDTFVQNADDTQVAEQDQAQTSSFSDSIALNGTQQAINAASSDWLIGNSTGTGWILSVSAPALSNGSHELPNALLMKAPVYSGGNLHNLLGNDYQPLNDNSAVSVYQNKPTTFTWTHPTGTWYLRVNSYVRDQRYSVSNIRLTEQGSTTNLLQNSDGPFTPDSSSIIACGSTAIDNYTYYENSTVYLEQGKTYTLSAQSNGVIGGDHYTYRTDMSNTNNHTVIWLASAPASNVENEIVSDDDTNSPKTSKLQLNDGSTYRIKVPANAYAGTYTTQIKWTIK